MTVIINVNKSSTYSKYNGLTFPIGDLLHSGAGVVLDGRNQTDFAFSELIIVDLQKELKTKDILILDKLEKYIEIKNIKI